MAFGTVFTLDGVAHTQATTIAEIGEQNIWDNLDGFFAAHSDLFNAASGMIAERTTDRLRNYGGVDTVDVQELDEFGQPSAQKIAVPGYLVGFPLRRFGNALQWTRDGFQNMSAEEFQRQVNAIANADERNLYNSIRRALFNPTNYNFRDWQLNRQEAIQLPVKALLNGDGEPIPHGPFNTVFDGSTHTHYLGVATSGTPLVAEVSAVIDTVAEHFTSGQMILYISQADESDIRGLTGFKEYVDARLIDQRADLVTRTTLNVTNTYDRAIGLFNHAEVWVRPWIPSGYALAFNNGQDSPLAMREHSAEGLRGLRLVAQYETYPLRANEWEHRFGFGVWNRAAAAVLDMTTGSGNYAAPAV